MDRLGRHKNLVHSFRVFQTHTVKSGSALTKASKRPLRISNRYPHQAVPLKNLAELEIVPFE